MKKNKYEKNPEQYKENRKKMHKKNRECLNKVEKVSQQVRQGTYFIGTVCHWYLYRRSVRLFEHEKCHILTAKLYYSVRSFDDKIYICNTCHKHVSRNENSLR